MLMFDLEKYILISKDGFDIQKDKIFVEMTKSLVEIITKKNKISDFKIKINKQAQNSTEIIFSYDDYIVNFTHGILDSFCIKNGEDFIYFKWEELKDFEYFLDVLKGIQGWTMKPSLKP